MPFNRNWNVVPGPQKGGDNLADGGPLPDRLQATGLVDERFEAELPANLSTVADQLRDDSAFLANRYPANSAVPEIRLGRKARWPWIAAAAVILVCIGIGTVAWQAGELPSVASNAPSSQPNTTRTVDRTASNSTRHDRQTDEPLINHGAQEVGFQPAPQGKPRPEKRS